MKKAVIFIIVALIAIAAFAFIANSLWGTGSCIFGGEDEKTECCEKEEVKKSCCDKKEGDDHHAKMMETLKPLRAEFEAELSEDEKAVIAEIQTKFADVDHTEMCPEGKEKFMQEHKADFEALTAIADNHKAYFDAMIEKMHAEEGEGCKHLEGEDKDKGHDDDGDVKATDPSKCPEAEKCKEATAKCKGEKTAEAEKEYKEKAETKCKEAEKCKDATAKCKGEKTEEAEKECKEKAETTCKEATEKCEKECLNTIKIHFLLLEY